LALISALSVNVKVHNINTFLSSSYNTLPQPPVLWIYEAVELPCQDGLPIDKELGEIAMGMHASHI
jgi:hypothetical protein